MRRAWICTFAILLTGCATQRVVQNYQRDSVNVVIKDSLRFRDSLVLVPVPQGGDKAVLPDTDTSRLETNIAESMAWVKDGRLHHMLRNKDEAFIPVTIKMPQMIHIEKETLLKAYRVTEIVEVEKELSRLQRFMMSLGWVVIIGAVAWLAWKIYRLVKI